MRRVRVLVVDDERSLLRSIGALLRKAGFDYRTTSSGDEAVDIAVTFNPDVVLLDLIMPGTDGLTVLQELKAMAASPEVIIITGVGTTERVVQTIKMGAYWFLDKPFAGETLVSLIRRAAERKFLASQVAARQASATLIGQSASMERLRDTIHKIADDPVTVFITGESGVGKELVATLLHELGSRASKPFKAINCGAIPDNLVESELFGHVRGAFTDAKEDKIGLFEAANGGTVFLDEVVELSPSAQVKLLRVLQEREVRRIGDTRTVSVDVRVIAATNIDPLELVAKGEFRRDLFYRLNVFPIHVPPLRERREDIPLLANHFLGKCLERSERQHKRIERFSPAAMDALQRYDWRGNVRELENAIERAVVICDGPEITPEYLPEEVRRAAGGARRSRTWSDDSYLAQLDWNRFRKEYIAGEYRRWLQALLARANGNRTEAARLAGMDRANFRKQLAKYQVVT